MRATACRSATKSPSRAFAAASAAISPSISLRALSSSKGPGPFELLDARMLIEGEIAALAAAHATEQDIAALRQALARMTAHVDDFAIREETDRDFHLGIARATGNGSLELVVEGLWNQRAELWGRIQQHFHTEALAKQTLRDHAAILAAVAARDSDAARAAMHRHIGGVAHDFQRGVTDTRQGKAARASAPARKPAARAPARA